MTREFSLPKVGDMATARILDMSYLAQVLSLQEETCAALPESQKRFILPRTPEYFRSFLTRQSGYMVGMLYKGRLIGQLAMLGPSLLEKAIENNTITYNSVVFHHAHILDEVMVAKSVAVHPDWRGNDIAQNLLSTALEQAEARACDHVFAQVSAENIRSWEMFLQMGFGIVAAGLDPTDGKPRFVLQRPSLGFAIHHAAGAESVDPITGFASIMRLTNFEALIGQIDTTSLSLRLNFRSSIENASTWSESAPEVESA
ncbi:MAG: GNAT family N-acetyltransferase [Alphaproteobacteria bacterium]|nr:GNAT family N-acetyltransferase [Alphaproteobacteria bacterium]